MPDIKAELAKYRTDALEAQRYIRAYPEVSKANPRSPYVLLAAGYEGLQKASDEATRTGRPIDENLANQLVDQVGGAQLRLQPSSEARKNLRAAVKALKRQTHETVEAMKERLKNRTAFVVDHPDGKGAGIVIAGPERFQDTPEGQAVQDGLKAIAGKFDWGALLAMIAAAWQKARTQVDADFLSKDQKSGAMSKVAEEWNRNHPGSDFTVEAERDERGRLWLRAKGKDGQPMDLPSEVRDELMPRLNKEFADGKIGVEVTLNAQADTAELGFTTGKPRSNTGDPSAPPAATMKAPSAPPAPNLSSTGPKLG